MKEAHLTPQQYRRDAVILALVIAATLAFVFAPYVFGNRSLLASAGEASSIYPSGATTAPPVPHYHTLDAGAPAWATEPWFPLEHRILFREHRMPFWDPYDGYGQPFDAAMQPQPFYPLTALFSVHLTPRTYTWFILTRLFIAGFFAALFVRLFADRYAAAVTGVATALSGYYLLYYSMPHLSVDVGLPMLLWATELVLRRPNARRCAVLALAAGLIYVGGMPETEMLSISLAILYALVRIIAMHPRRVTAPLTALATAHVCGICLGAITIVPFLELFKRSFDTHQPGNIGGIVVGLQADTTWQRPILIELAPLSFGFPWESVLGQGVGHSGIRGFFGCTVLFLAIVALVAAVRRRDERLSVVGFFCAVAAFCILKRYGNPLVQWTGTLPLFDLVQFPKYVEFELGCAMAILAGFGVAALREHRAGARAVGAAFFVALAILSYLDLSTRGTVPSGVYAWENGAAVALAAIALLAAAGLAYAVVTMSDRRRRAASIALAVLVVAEITAGYAGPELWRSMPPIAENPYAGTPYLTYLDQHVDRSSERVFGLSGMLFPNWPGAFGFSDPRSLNALYPREYLPFVDAFFTKRPIKTDDLYDRFAATRPVWLGSSLVRRWMELSSIAWIMSPVPVVEAEAPAGGFLDAMWQQVQPTLDEQTSITTNPTTVEIGNVAEDVLFEHPPNDSVLFTTVVPKSRPIVFADIALKPESYAGPQVCGGPVTFTLQAESLGKTLATSTQTIDPKHNLAQRRWMPFSLNLTHEAGRQVKLRFETAAADTCSAWAVWGEPRFANTRDAHPLRSTHETLQSAYHADGVYIYRNRDALPRLTIVHNVKVAADAPTALALMTAPHFDPRVEAVVESPVEGLQKAVGPERVSVLRERSDLLVADVTASTPGLLIQNDTDYPGWVADVDGHRQPIVRTDELFRGIPVPAGRHTVTITYDSAAARIGTIVTALGLVFLVCLFFGTSLLERLANAIRRRRRIAAA